MDSITLACESLSRTPSLEQAQMLNALGRPAALQCLYQAKEFSSSSAVVFGLAVEYMDAYLNSQLRQGMNSQSDSDAALAALACFVIADKFANDERALSLQRLSAAFNVDAAALANLEVAVLLAL